ncbi:hypothetical protein ACQCRB_19075, partial [Ralstonia pseudosolanacearum]
WVLGGVSLLMDVASEMIHSLLAMFMLANAYRDGDGVPRDEARALALYEQAAEHELPEAVQALAMAYQNGELGLARDDAAFRKQWLETAHALKHPALAP